jgi:anti-sigma regulatory factor (Ser/Thr protein kinase)
MKPGQNEGTLSECVRLFRTTDMAVLGSRRLLDFLDRGSIGKEIRFALEHALSEHLQNIVDHSSACAVDLSFESNHDSVTVTINDDGIPFDPTGHPKPDLGIEFAERPIGGLGIHMMRSFVDVMIYSRKNSGNELILVKRKQLGKGG